MALFFGGGGTGSFLRGSTSDLAMRGDGFVFTSGSDPDCVCILGDTERGIVPDDCDFASGKESADDEFEAPSGGRRGGNGAGRCDILLDRGEEEADLLFNRPREGDTMGDDESSTMPKRSSSQKCRYWRFSSSFVV